MRAVLPSVWNSVYKVREGSKVAGPEPYAYAHFQNTCDHMETLQGLSRALHEALVFQALKSYLLFVPW